MPAHPLPPSQLVSSFRFVTASSATSAPEDTARVDFDAGPSSATATAMLEEQVGVWQGKTVFTDRFEREKDDRPPITTAINATPVRDSSARAFGSASSPIPISPSPTPSPSRDPLPRPRGVPAYTSSLPRTAYTPPSRPSLSPPAPSRSRTVDHHHKATSAKPIHPFFTRARSAGPLLAPEASQPRLVATYSSTSDSQTTTDSQQSIGTGWGGMAEEDIERLAEEIEDLRLGKAPPVPTPVPKTTKREPLRPAKRAPLPTSLGKGKSKAVVPPPPSLNPDRPWQAITVPLKTEPPILDSLPPFHYATFDPRRSSTHPPSSFAPPKIVYTNDAAEANDLLSCLDLRGTSDSGRVVLGFDMEWPVSGSYKTQDKYGREFTKTVGAVWGEPGQPPKWVQPRTEVVGLSDDKLCVVVHLMGMTELPEKLVEIIANPKVVKCGVAVRGDGLKLLRDFPAAFPNGIPSLLELSTLARRVDPLNTGPGNRLISLQTLAAQYLGVKMDKEATIRKGMWCEALDQAQIDYAANDVYAGLQLYLALERLARANDHGVDLAAGVYLSDLKIPGAALTAAGAKHPSNVIQSGMKPREERALARFEEGFSCEEIAEEGGIKLSTVQSYILGALLHVPPDYLPEERRLTLLNGLDPVLLRKAEHRKVIRELQGGQRNTGHRAETQAGVPDA